LLVWLEFRSARITALVGLSLPFALVGGVVGVALTGGVLSLGSLVGFVTVIGISARNGTVPRPSLNWWRQRHEAACPVSDADDSRLCNIALAACASDQP
jgi:Cu/Ag efflux pump CusA